MTTQLTVSAEEVLADKRLRKVERLLRRAQFLRVQRTGRRMAAENLAVYAAKNKLGITRVGITTSRKVGNAVRRNRWRRLIREAFRLDKQSFPAGYDLVVIVAPNRAPTKRDDVFEELAPLARRAAELYEKKGARRPGKRRGKKPAK